MRKHVARGKKGRETKLALSLFEVSEVSVPLWLRPAHLLLCVCVFHGFIKVGKEGNGRNLVWLYMAISEGWLCVPIWVKLFFVVCVSVLFSGIIVIIGLERVD